MCPSSVINSLLRFSCQSGSPASRSVGAKCLVCALVRHVFLAENFQVCSFSKCKAARSPSYAVGHGFCSRCLTGGWGAGVQNTGGQRAGAHSLRGEACWTPCPLVNDRNWAARGNAHLGRMCSRFQIQLLCYEQQIGHSA